MKTHCVINDQVEQGDQTNRIRLMAITDCEISANHLSSYLDRDILEQNRVNGKGGDWETCCWLMNVLSE